MKITVILNDIRSVHNVGSIFRTADGVGVEKLYLCGITPKPFDRLRNLRPDFAKVALGAEKYVTWEYVADVADIIAQLREEGYIICALEQSERSIPYYDVPGKLPFVGEDEMKIAIILGAEVKGIPFEVLGYADHVLEIPMRGAMLHDKNHPKRDGEGKESLNVAIAFGIVVFGLRYGKKE